MKKSMFLFGALFAEGLSFTACSSDNDVVGNNVPTGENGGNKYLAIGINLPQAVSGMTRAGGTDNNGQVTYHDGLATEYAVKNATLIIFNNASNEDDATFVAAYTINTAPWTGTGTSNNVTETSTKVVKLVDSKVVAGYRAMVVLNHNNILTVSDDGGLSVNGIALSSTSTYADFRESLTDNITTLDASKMTSAGFFMANAPLSNSKGSTSTSASGTTSTLVDISSSAIYKSEAEAQAGTSYDQIFVERGVAKVTMQQNDGTSTMTNSKVATANDLTWQVTGWILDNTAPTTYLVRSTKGDSDFRALKSQAASPTTAGVYRYIGNTEVYDGVNASTGKYRTYFAPSIGYDTWASGSTYSLNTYSTGDFTTTFGETSPKYCYENTFDVDHQNVKNTTLVQLAITAKYGGSAVDLYTLGGQKTTVYTEALLETAIKETAYYVLLGDGVTFNTTFGTSDITVTMPTTSVAGTVTLDPSNTSCIKVIPDVGKIASGYTEATFYTNLSAALGEIVCYKGGVSYYSIRIKHFGDNLTPWNTWEATQSLNAPSSTTIYPNNVDNRNGDYLGRYGVLRNNWYDISVSSVRSLGDATPHTGDWPDTPDDELDNYLAFRINVLSWAKRTQSADL